MALKTILKRSLKLAFSPMVYRYYPIGLQPSRFYFWTDSLYRTRALKGSVVEIGIAAGGTSASSYKFLRQIQSNREYVCVDTFDGFPKEQFAQDVKLGNSWKRFDQFSSNSISLVRKVLKQHDAEGVTLIQGDISTIDPALLPKTISACLLDVDLAVPVYDGLKLIWPLLEAGGIIVVDDCYENNIGDWQAYKGYKRFCQELGLKEHFFCGVGYLVNGDQDADSFPKGLSAFTA